MFYLASLQGNLKSYREKNKKETLAILKNIDQCNGEKKAKKKKENDIAISKLGGSNNFSGRCNSGNLLFFLRLKTVN